MYSPTEVSEEASKHDQARLPHGAGVQLQALTLPIHILSHAVKHHRYTTFHPGDRSNPLVSGRKGAWKGLRTLSRTSSQAHFLSAFSAFLSYTNSYVYLQPLQGYFG